MNFSISNYELSKKLNVVSKAIDNKAVLPIMQNVVFNIKDNVLTLVGSNGDNYLRAMVTLIQCEENISFGILCSDLLNVIERLTDDVLSFDVNMENATATVTHNNGSFSLPVCDVNDYPVLSLIPENALSVNINGICLSNMIARTIIATANDNMRPIMNGILFDVKKDKLTLVASDGHILVRDNIALKTECESSSFICPKQAASLVKLITSKNESDVTINFGTMNAVFSCESYTLNCRLIEGVYPNYRSVIPSLNENSQTCINRVSLTSAIKRLLIFAGTTALVKMTVKDNILSLQSRDIDFSKDCHENISCNYSGNPLTIGFKGTIIEDILSSLNGENIKLQVEDPSRAGLFIPENQPENEDVLMLLMPMMLNE